MITLKIVQRYEGESRWHTHVMRFDDIGAAIRAFDASVESLDSVIRAAYDGAPGAPLEAHALGSWHSRRINCECDALITLSAQ